MVISGFLRASQSRAICQPRKGRCHDGISAANFLCDKRAAVSTERPLLSADILRPTPILQIHHVLADCILQRTDSAISYINSPRVSLTIDFLQAFRAVARPARNPLTHARFAPLQIRLLSQETRTAIDQAVASAPVVLFMKGTPEMPQCGFSRASIQILGMQGVDPNKFTAFNVLEDNELREGWWALISVLGRVTCSSTSGY